MNQIGLGVFFLFLAGVASGGFYVPYKFVKRWSWEVYWITGGIMSWIIAPWVLALLLSKGLIPTILATWQIDPNAVIWAFLYGMMWGVGGLSFGLAIRYLGMSLGMAVALGYCTVIGTLVPPILKGEFVSKILASDAGWVNLFGLGACTLGIALAGAAGMSKEKEMSDEAKRESIKEFSFVKGMIMATIAGVFSAGMAFGIDKATPLAVSSQYFGTDALWSGLPKLCVILLGGFTSNFIWCLILLAKNKTFYEFTAKYQKADLAAAGVDANSSAAIEAADKSGKLAGMRIPIFGNIFFSFLAGLTWYLQFFFYTMGETKMGTFKFSCWTLHMAFGFICSSLFGLALHEWKGSSRFTKTLLFMALATLIYSTLVVGYSNFMNADADNETTQIVAAQSVTEGEGATAVIKTTANAELGQTIPAIDPATGKENAPFVAEYLIYRGLDQGKSDEAKARIEAIEKEKAAKAEQEAAVETKLQELYPKK